MDKAARSHAGRHRRLGRDTARNRAVEILMEIGRGRELASAALERSHDDRPLSAPETSLTHELVMGVVRHRLTIDRIAQQYFEGQWHRLDPRMRGVLEVAVYQLCWLDRVPAFAAVNEAVEQAKRVGGRKAGGLMNAVLRALLRARGERIDRPADADPRRWLGGDGGRGFLFEDELWPDPATEPAEHLAAMTSVPFWIAARWLKRFGLERATRICETAAQRPPLVLRANRVRLKAPELRERLEARGVQTRYDVATGAVEPIGVLSVSDLPEFEEGRCQPQDATSQSVWLRWPPRPGQRVVDLCAGAGTKATQAAELMDDRGQVFASDIDVAKLSRLRSNAERLGLQSIQCVAASALHRALTESGGPPDVILVDVPCSNSGVFGRRPEARYRLEGEGLARLAERQAALLEQAAALAGPQTRLIYSTCSLEPEENEEVIQAFCVRRPQWRLETSHLTLPHAGDAQQMWRDGGYAAALLQA